MPSTFLGIEIAKRSLAAHQQALNVTGHNIANANTEGYSRQRVRLETTEPGYPVSLTSPQIAGQIGTGVTVAAVERIRDVYLDSRIEFETQSLGYWNALYDKLHRIELIYNEPSDSSIRNLLNQFWQSLKELANNPEESKIREIVKQRGVALAEGIQHTYKRFFDLRDNINNEIIDLVDQMNDMGAQIAELNGKIKKVENEGQNPNDLLDKRGLLLENLSELADIRIGRTDPDDFKISIGGMVFVQRDHLHPLATTKDVENDKMARIYWQKTGDEAVFTSGKVGALLDARDTFIDDYHIARLDEYAIFLIDSFNEIHRAGFGLNGSTNVDFFEPFKTLDEDRIFKVTGSEAGYVHDVNMDLHDPFDSSCTTLAANPSMVGLNPVGAFEINGHVFNYVASEDSLQDIVDRINAANIGVVAHISPAHRLVLRAMADATYENTSIKTPYTISSLSDDPERTEYESTTSRDEVALNELAKTRDFKTAGFDPKFNLNTRIRVTGGAAWTDPNTLGSYATVNDFITAFNTNVANVTLSYNSNTDRFTVTNNSAGAITIQDIEATTTNPVTSGFVAMGAKLSTGANTTSVGINSGATAVSREMVVTNDIDMTKAMSALDTTCAFATAGFNTVPSTSLDLSLNFANAGFLNAPTAGALTISDGTNSINITPTNYSTVQDFINALNTNCQNAGVELTLSYNPEADKFIFEAGGDNVTITDAGDFLANTNFTGPLNVNSGTFKISQAGVGPGVSITGAVTWSGALSDFSSIDEFMDSITDAGLNLGMTYSLYNDQFTFVNNNVGAVNIAEVIPTGGVGFWAAAKVATGAVAGGGGSATTAGEVVDNNNPSTTPVSFKRAGLITHAGNSVITIRSEDTPNSNQYTTHKFYIDPERTSVRELMSAINTSNCGVDISYNPTLDKFTIQADTRGTDFAVSETLGIKSGNEVSDGGTITLGGDWTAGSNWDTIIADAIIGDQTIKINGVEFILSSSGALGTYSNLQSLINGVNSSLAGVTMNYNSTEPDRLTITSDNGERIIIEGGRGAGATGDFWDEVKIERGIHGGLLAASVIPSGEVAGNLLEKLGILAPGQSYKWKPQEPQPDPPIAALAGEYVRTPDERASYFIDLTEDIMNDLHKIAAAKGIDTSVPLDGVWDQSNGVGDGSNALDLANLKHEDIFDSGTATFHEFFGTTVAKVGSEVNAAKEQGENQQLFIDNLNNLRQSISGVSLDEELINMIKFQHGYQAAAQITAVLNQMIQTVIGLVG